LGTTAAANTTTTIESTCKKNKSAEHECIKTNGNIYRSPYAGHNGDGNGRVQRQIGENAENRAC
jgi:hypothetical protein